MWPRVHPFGMDERDRKILDRLQADATLSVNALAEAVSLSPSAVSRRIQRMEEDGIIARRVVILDRVAMGLPTTIYVLVKTSRHSAEWLDAFKSAVGAIPEIVEVHRLTGNVDYICKIVLPNVEHYDVVYKRLLARLELFEMSAYISMETLKSGTRIPTNFA